MVSNPPCLTESAMMLPSGVRLNCTVAPATGRPWMSRIVSTQNISFRPLGTQASVLLASELTVFVRLFETLLA